MKTRNWKKINSSFTVELNGQEGEEIRQSDYMQASNKPMEHHPIMSKIAKFMIVIGKKSKIVEVVKNRHDQITLKLFLPI
jgi:hypothetical protein